ncbi:MAG TPA: hypothetical protein VND65_06060 [Candidatus Binatia bacterium]|nr:hypothetical protein [Candidatus Binatia bacterium]
MSKMMKRWLSSWLVLAIAAGPALAGSNDGKPASENNANANNAEPAAAASPSLAPAATDANVTALLGVLVMKGVLAPGEANAIHNAAPDTRFQLLVEALNRKGVLTAADLSAAPTAASQPMAAAAPQPPSAPQPVPVALSTPDPQAAQTAAAAPPPPAVVPAIAPLRVLPVDPPKKDGLAAAFKTGPVKLTPYGFIKTTAAYDSSSPNGDDFPFVGLFLTTPQTFDTGPTKDPEFHIKARSTRIGANFEWPDISPRLTFTGRIEGDYEGNFSEVDNRDVSSIRSNAFQLRLAWARMDYQATDRTDLYFEGGQDWTLFGSGGALMPILETTFLGAFYGDPYTRSPQFQFGAVHDFGGSRHFKVSPTFALMMPSSGQILKLGSVGLAGQLGEGEREGADAARPELEGRIAFQWQADKAPGVAPAQVLVTAFDSRRKSIAPFSSYSAQCANPGEAIYCTTFPNGVTASSSQYGEQVALQLPTRWFTLVASAYQGGDLRFFFGGQVNSYATNTAGLTNLTTPLSTLDGGPLAAAGAVVIGTNSSGQAVVAPQKPIRSFGGFASLGLPLSRWANANPKGHNAGWQLFFTVGKDQVNNHDLNNPAYTANANTLSPLPLLMGKMFAATLYYKINPWVTFSFEQSVYGTRLNHALCDPSIGITTACYNIAGQTSDEWQDHRTEFGPIFTF